MFYNLHDPAQRQALAAAMVIQQIMYENAFILSAGGGVYMLLEPWLNPAAVR